MHQGLGGRVCGAGFVVYGVHCVVVHRWMHASAEALNPTALCAKGRRGWLCPLLAGSYVWFTLHCSPVVGLPVTPLLLLAASVTHSPCVCMCVVPWHRVHASFRVLTMTGQVAGLRVYSEPGWHKGLGRSSCDASTTGQHVRDMLCVTCTACSCR